MVKWIGKLLLLLKRLKDSWMDMLPKNNMSETKDKIYIMLMWPVKMKREEAEVRNF